MPTRVFITGAAGFIGSHLTSMLAADAEVSVTELAGDLSDTAALRTQLSEAQPDILIHLAAISHPLECTKAPMRAYTTNVAGTANLLEVWHTTLAEAAPKAKTPVLIFASTAQVYRATPASDVPWDETHPLEPQNTYARTKLAAERLIQDFVTPERARFQAIVLRLFNHTHFSQPPEFFLPGLHQALLELKDTVEPREIPVGNLELDRDMGSLQDLVQAFMAVIRDPKSQRFEVYNVASGVAKSLENVASELMKQSGIHATLRADPRRFRADEPKRIAGSSLKLQARTGWKPTALDARTLVASFLAPLRPSGQASERMSS